MPADTVRVVRPSRWGNPYKLGMTVPDDWAVGAGIQVNSRELAVQLFRDLMRESPDYRRAARTALAGRNLACWCPIEDADGGRVPCHGDVLLQIANGQPEEGARTSAWPDAMSAS